jgi:hypothetical protein
MNPRLAVVAFGLVLSALPASPATAATVAACTFDGTFTFSPPLSVQPAYGDVTGSGTVTCVQVDAGTGGGSWGTVTFVVEGASKYAGSCLEATYTDGYGLSVLVAGSVATTVWTEPFVATQTGVFTPVDGDCATGLVTAHVVSAGPGPVQ